MFEKPFLFQGRIGRAEYVLSLIICFVLFFILILVIEESSGELFFLELVYLPMFWFLVAQGAKRCHDIGITGWMQLIPFYVFWMIFYRGNSEANSYGFPFIKMGDIGNIELTENLKVVLKSETFTENDAKEITFLEIKNVNYSKIPIIINRLETVDKVNQLNYEHFNTTVNITINHKTNTEKLVKELHLILPNMEVTEVTYKTINIRLR